MQLCSKRRVEALAGTGPGTARLAGHVAGPSLPCFPHDDPARCATEMLHRCWFPRRSTAGFRVILASRSDDARVRRGRRGAPAVCDSADEPRRARFPAESTPRLLTCTRCAGLRPDPVPELLTCTRCAGLRPDPVPELLTCTRCAGLRPDPVPELLTCTRCAGLRPDPVPELLTCTRSRLGAARGQHLSRPGRRTLNALRRPGRTAIVAPRAGQAHPVHSGRFKAGRHTQDDATAVPVLFRARSAGFQTECRTATPWMMALSEPSSDCRRRHRGPTPQSRPLRAAMPTASINARAGT